MKDIENAYSENSINLSKLERSDKFIKFKKWTSEDGQVRVEFDQDMYIFTSDYLECDKIQEDEKQKSLKNMLNHLDKHIDQEIEKDLVDIRRNLIRQKRIKYNYQALKSKLKI